MLTFLLLMATVGGGLYLWESRTEYAHSRGGIERLRIVESADLEMARIDGELELRRMALEAYINLCTRRATVSDSATLQRIEALVQRLALDNAQLRGQSAPAQAGGEPRPRAHPGPCAG